MSRSVAMEVLEIGRGPGLVAGLWELMSLVPKRGFRSV
jgi:hypothetical protein